MEKWFIILTFSLIETFYLTKKGKQNWNTFNIAFLLLFWGKVLFLPKKLFWKKIGDINKFKRQDFLKLCMCLHLCAKLQVSSIMLTTFKQGREVISYKTPLQNEPLENPPTLGSKTRKFKNCLLSTRDSHNRCQRRSKKASTRSWKTLLEIFTERIGHLG